ncbi:MAG TPA: hypothetical protein VE844_13445 [Gammaproteobacteria bacterium]|nr:hypothetical protein [Gammaproteobacteria bacterium]
MQPEQTVSEMAAEVLGRQAKARAHRSGQSLEEALAEVLKTPAGRRLGELADGPHRHQKAAQWQASLIEERAAQRALEGVVPR